MTKGHPPPLPRGRGWHRGWYVCFGGFLGAAAGALTFWLVFPSPDQLRAEIPDPSVEAFLAPSLIPWLYLLGLGMYGIAPGFLVGSFGGFLAWWRAGRPVRHL